MRALERASVRRCNETIMAVKVSYRLTGTGWAEARVADGSASVTITAPNLEDALGVLLEAVGTLLEGADEARWLWEEEPGEYRWVFERACRSRARL